MQTKNFFKIAVVIFSMLFFQSCPDENNNAEETEPIEKTEPNANSQLLGTWEYVEYPYSETIFMIRLEFKADGTYTGESWEILYGSKWESGGASKNPLYANFNDEQVKNYLHNQPWSSDAYVGKWSATDTKLISATGFFDNDILDCSRTGDLLIIKYDGEDYVYSKYE